MHLRCPKCKQMIFDISEDKLGRTVHCTSCRQIVRVPAKKGKLGTGFKEGWLLIKRSIDLIIKRPILALPIFCSWVVVASVTLYGKYVYESTSSVLIECFVAFVMIFIMSLSICISNVFMLEFIERMESGKQISLVRATFDAVFRDLIKVIPIAIVWAFIWWVIVIIRCIKRRGDDDLDDDFSLQGAAETLAGLDNSPTTWWTLGLSMFEKLVRMTVFLALPAITWENKWPASAISKAISIIKKHPIQFLTTYTLTELALLIMFLPILPIFVLAKLKIAIPAIVWFFVILYEGIAWTLGVYLEQMAVGLLYLWQMNWERYGSTSELEDHPKPDLLDAALLIKNK
ncbi:MAG: hypothetical protein BWY28_00520 [bacterium ADurb.Bin236]|nr:MAG: hypothetical protein BWY28_00520 [bacterium ADurb.Bin236]